MNCDLGFLDLHRANVSTLAVYAEPPYVLCSSGSQLRLVRDESVKITAVSCAEGGGVAKSPIACEFSLYYWGIK